MVSDIYEGANKLLSWKCLNDNCNEKFEMRWSNLHNGQHCPYCSGKKAGSKNNLTITHPELADEWNINNIISPFEVTYGSTKQINWICSKCTHMWTASLNSRTGKDGGCPKCNTSKLEKNIENFLNINDIEFIFQYRFNDCRSKLPLPFDFYLPKLNICIEADGIQHIKAYKFFGGEEKFKTLKKHDKIKDNYCLSNNIKLIRISYSEINNITKILSQELLVSNNITE